MQNIFQTNIYAKIYQINTVLANVERSEMDLYEVFILLILFGFGMGTMLESFHVWGIMLMLRASVVYVALSVFKS